MAESADINVDELRRRARRRLVGAVVLALGVAVVVPMLLETEQKSLPEDVSVKIPPIDDGKFVNRLSENRAQEPAAPAKSPAASDASKDAAAPPAATAPPAERTSKYDTRIPEPSPESAAAPPAPSASTGKSAAPAVVSRPPVSASPAAAPPPAATTPPASTPAATTPATAPAATTPATAPAASTQPPVIIEPSKVAPPPHEGFAVQLAAFADDKGAAALASRLKKAGYTAYTEPLKTSKGTLWRVRVGPYPSREAAVAARDRLKAEGQSGIVAAVK